MIFKSKLYTFVFQYIGSLQNKFLLLQKNFPSVLALVLFGFLVGNVFGTFLNTLRFVFLWDGFIILLIIGLMEILNYNVYNVKNPILYPKILVQFINFFKIGFMIGFFVDAFKVGS